LESGKRVHRIEGNIISILEHCMAVRSLKYSPDHNILVSGSDDLHINLIDLTNNKVIQALVGHKESITTIEFNKHLNLYASSSLDGSIKLWDYRNKASNCVQTINLSNDYYKTSYSNDILQTTNKYLVNSTEYSMNKYLKNAVIRK
jgi:WD40 repeat protein